MLTRGGLSGGARKYLEEMGAQWAGLHPTPDVRYFLPDTPAVRAWWDERAATEFWPLSRTGRTPGRLQRRLNEWAPDVVFIPTSRWIRGLTVPQVVMVRNMEPLRSPPGVHVPFLEAWVNRLRRWEAGRAASQAQGVICVSDFVEREVQRLWRLPVGQIRVIPHGSGPALPLEGARRPSGLPQVVKGGDFLFTLGSLRPHRSLEDLIQALAVLRDQGREVAVAIGGHGERGSGGYPQQLRRLAQRLHVDPLISWLGALDRREVTWCFHNAMGFVMTSRVEACPNVVLEAMVHGTPSISTTAEPMPEFYEDAALYYAPGDAEELARQIVRLRQEPEIREALRTSALLRSREFTWEATAGKTLEYLEEVAGQPPSSKSSH